MALENIATKVGSKIIPIIVPSVDDPIMTLYWFSTNSKVLSFGAVSTKLPVNGCCIILAILEKITIKLKSDNPEANNLTLAPDNLTA